MGRIAERKGKRNDLHRGKEQRQGGVNHWVRVSWPVGYSGRLEGT